MIDLVHLALALFLGLSGAVPGAGSSGEAEAAQGDPDLAAFDSRLKQALANQDAEALAFLVQFPLRLNHGDGGVTLISNPRALQTFFSVAFPESVRRTVIAATGADIFWRGTTFGYGDGVVWGERLGEDDSKRFRVLSVNLPASPVECGEKCFPQLDFVCETAEHRVIIDRVSSENWRYRAWNRPRFPPAEPNLVLVGGEQRSEGTTPCVSATWAFRSGSVLYEVSEHGACYNSDDIGTLSVMVGDQPTREWACY